MRWNRENNVTPYVGTTFVNCGWYACLTAVLCYSQGRSLRSSECLLQQSKVKFRFLASEFFKMFPSVYLISFLVATA
jgi:hypothetical protein